MFFGEAVHLRTKEIKTPLNIVQGQERVRGKRHFISGPCPHEDMALPFYKIYGGMDCEAEADCISAENAAAAERTHSGAVCDDLSQSGKVTGKRKDPPCGAGRAGNVDVTQRCWLPRCIAHFLIFCSVLILTRSGSQTQYYKNRFQIRLGAVLAFHLKAARTPVFLRM